MYVNSPSSCSIVPPLKSFLNCLRVIPFSFTVQVSLLESMFAWTLTLESKFFWILSVSQSDELMDELVREVVASTVLFLEISASRLKEELSEESDVLVPIEKGATAVGEAAARGVAPEKAKTREAVTAAAAAANWRGERGACMVPQSTGWRQEVCSMAGLLAVSVWPYLRAICEGLRGWWSMRGSARFQSRVVRSEGPSG